MMTRISRIVTTALLAATAMAAVSGDALARRGVRHRTHLSKRHLRNHVVRDVPPQTTVNLAPMRYYGGPKSPMWRG